MKKTVLLLVALFMLDSSDLCSQTINSAEPQGRLIIRLVAPSLNLTQRDQIMQRIQARFGDVGGMFEQGSVNDTNNTYLTIVITPTRISATTGSSSSNNARSGRIFSNTQDYLTMPFNASTNPNSFYDITLSFTSGGRGSRFISRSESHDFARYNSSSLSGLGRLEWSAMLSAVNGADQFIADAIYASFQQNMSVLSQSSGGNEE